MGTMGLHHITILHTNDYHGQLRPVRAGGRNLGGAPQKAALIKALRGRKSGAVLVDAGDLAEGSLAAKHTRGKVVVEEMNEEGYALAVPGNHDFDWGIGALEAMARTAHFPFVAANITDASGGEIPWLKPYVIKEVDGLKTAFIGVTTPESKDFLPENEQNILKFMKPYPSIKHTIKQARKEGADFVVVVSHLGIAEDRELAKRLPGVPIVGGHSHTILPEGERVGTSMIVQAGSHGEYVGKLDLLVDDRGKVVRADERLHPVETENLPADPRVERIVAPALAAESDAFHAVVGESLYPLTRVFRDTSNFSEILADAQRDAVGCRFGLVSNFGVAQDLPAGPISKGHLNDVVPWDENLISVELSGAALKRAIEYSMGDRSYSVLVPSGFSFEFDRRNPEGERVSSIRMGEEPLNLKKTYALAVNAHDLAFNPVMKREGKNVKTCGPMRDALEEYIRIHSPLEKKGPDGRMRNLERGENQNVAGPRPSPGGVAA